MTTAVKSENPTLSRFFQDSFKLTKKQNSTKNFNKLPYFANCINQEGNLAKRHVVKRRKSCGSQFKGFSAEVQVHSKADTDQKELLITRMKENIKKRQTFSGFYPEEIQQSENLRDKLGKKVADLENQCQNFFVGFSKQERTESKTDLSKILHKYLSIKSNVYKNIDMRVLTYHFKQENDPEQIVCSKYWSKEENKIVELEDSGEDKKNGLHLNRTLIMKYPNYIFSDGNERYVESDVKSNYTEADVNDSKADLFLEIQKLPGEMKILRVEDPPPSTTANQPQIAPFLQTKKELLIPPFLPPKSPHCLIEEELYHDPWALLVSTIFLNKTSGRSARPFVFWFLKENPDPLIVVGKKVEELETYFGLLGLQKTRALQVWRMSHDFIYKKWKKVSELYGIGRYGEEAFRIFCLGDFSFEPKDRYLRIYKAWYEMQEKNDRVKEMNSHSLLI